MWSVEIKLHLYCLTLIWSQLEVILLVVIKRYARSQKCVRVAKLRVRKIGIASVGTLRWRIGCHCLMRMMSHNLALNYSEQNWSENAIPVIFLQCDCGITRNHSFSETNPGWLWSFLLWSWVSQFKLDLMLLLIVGFVFCS